MKDGQGTQADGSLQNAQLAVKNYHLKELRVQ